MDLNAKDSDGHGNDEEEDAGGICSAADEDDKDGDEETKSLLPAGENGMPRSLEKGKRKVRWNDSAGNNLAEVREFLPRRRLA